VPYNSKVFTTVVFAHPAVILMKGYVKNPMQAVFNASMASYAWAKASISVTDVIKYLFSCRIASGTMNLSFFPLYKKSGQL